MKNKSTRIKNNGNNAQQGTSLVEMALMLPFLLLLVMAAVDFGRAYYMAIEVDNAARAGAQYGELNPTDTAGMQTAATADGSDVTGLAAVATTGCMCADGTGSVQTPCNNTSPPTCGSQTRVVDFVTVNTQATYTPFFPFASIFGATLTIRGSATLLAGTS